MTTAMPMQNDQPIRVTTGRATSRPMAVPVAAHATWASAPAASTGGGYG
jgi:hypothetical protein